MGGVAETPREKEQPGSTKSESFVMRGKVFREGSKSTQEGVTT